MAWITTKDGRKVNTDWFTDEERKKYQQIEAAQEQAKERNNPQPAVSKKQQEWEEKYRNSKNEHIAFFDANGNVVFEAEGTAEEVSVGGVDDWDRHIAFNRNVEQHIWNDEEINSSHNHPENTIFSPEDIESYEDLECHSESAALADGTTYRLIRRQPRTSNTWRINEKTGEYEREFEPKKIYPAYYEAYSAVYNPGWQKIRQETMWGTPERQKAIEELDMKVRKTMEKWLVQNAANYGYEFVKEKK